MDFGEVKELISIVNDSKLMSFSLKMDNVAIEMSKLDTPIHGAAALPQANASETAVPAPAVQKPAKSPEKKKEAPAEKTEKGNIVKSPIVGTFFASPGIGKEPFVKKGDSVKKGDVLCIVEAMKIMNEINSPYDGTVEEICAENESLVEYGQPLFRIV